MATVDLAHAANLNATTGKVRSTWSGGKLHFNEQLFLELVVRAVAATMGLNLYNGLRPDGSGPMPGRKKDGEPRGKGSKIARALHPKKVGALSWFIAAHLENPGHLGRIMGGVPLQAPPIERIRAGVHRAYETALRLAESTSTDRSGVGDIIDRRSQKATRRRQSRMRDAFARQLGELGFGHRSALAKRIRSAARKNVRSRSR